MPTRAPSRPDRDQDQGQPERARHDRRVAEAACDPARLLRLGRNRTLTPKLLAARAFIRHRGLLATRRDDAAAAASATGTEAVQFGRTVLDDERYGWRARPWNPASAGSAA